MALFKIFSPSAIKDKLTRTSARLSSGLVQIFTHKKLDEVVLEDLEDLLLGADLGIAASKQIIADLRAEKFNKQISETEIKEFLAAEIAKIIEPFQKSLPIETHLKPQVIIFNGVNGVGKTTTIGKIAKILSDEGKKVTIAACDTFRAAASKQLEVWANRANCPIVEALKEGEDPASVAYRALSLARQENSDVLLIDTAGRLQNKKNLMDELRKINQILKKLDQTAPHQNILIIDATTGQNARNQLEVFDQIIAVSGLIVTKLDGSAKGGMIVDLSVRFGKPIYGIGVGEKIEDLQEFNAIAFAQALVGL